MKKLGVGVQTSKTWFDEANPAESIRFIKKCGFETIDYNMGSMFLDTFDKENVTSFFDQSIEELYEYYKPLKAALEENGVQISQAHGLFFVYEAGEEKLNDYYISMSEKMFAICRYLDCKVIVIHPWIGSEMTKSEEMQKNMSIYQRLIPAAKMYGVKICLENLFKKIDRIYLEGTCCDAQEVCQYIDRLNASAGEPVFGFCLDVGHAVMVRKNLYQFIKAIGERLTVLHIHENDGANDSHMIPFTQREQTGMRPAINWSEFVRGLKEIGYEGPLSFETVLGEKAWPEEIREEGFRFISAVGKYFRKTMEEGSFDRR